MPLCSTLFPVYMCDLLPHKYSSKFRGEWEKESYIWGLIHLMNCYKNDTDPELSSTFYTSFARWKKKKKKRACCGWWDTAACCDEGFKVWQTATLKFPIALSKLITEVQDIKPLYWLVISRFATCVSWIDMIIVLLVTGNLREDDLFRPHSKSYWFT